MQLETLFLMAIHKIHEHFGKSAILKGGMEMRLYESPRFTNDLDYVFVPFKSKKVVLQSLKKVLTSIPNAKVRESLHSTSGRYYLSVNNLEIQLEFNVEKYCKSTPLSTEALSRTVGELPRVIQVMSPDVALAHKLAAWNERRLIRDLYDAYFFLGRVGVQPDWKVLEARLAHIKSRLPRMKKIKKMTRIQFLDQIKMEIDSLTEEKVFQEIGPVLPAEVLPGLDRRICSVLKKFIEIGSD